jgi:hypothetical protein
MSLCSINDLLEYKVGGAGNPIGEIKNILFDKTTWSIKFIIVQSSEYPFAGLAIPVEGLEIPISKMKSVQTGLSVEEIDQLPTAIKAAVQTKIAPRHSIKYWRIGNFSRFQIWLNRLRELRIIKNLQSIPQQSHIIYPQLCSAIAVRGCRVLDDNEKIGVVVGINIDVDDWKIDNFTIITSESYFKLSPEKILRIDLVQGTINLKADGSVPLEGV